MALEIKNPAFRRKTGFFSTPPFTALHRRPIVKRVQAGVLTYGSPYSLPLPILRPFDKLRVQDSGSGKFRPRLQRRGRPRFSRGSPLSSPPPEYESVLPSYTIMLVGMSTSPCLSQGFRHWTEYFYCKALVVPAHRSAAFRLPARSPALQDETRARSQET